MAKNAAGRTIWDDQARSDLLQAVMEVAPPTAEEWNSIMKKIYTKGYTYNAKAALQHLQKLKRKEPNGPAGGAAPSTPKGKKPGATATGSAKSTSKRGRKTAKTTLDEDDDEELDEFDSSPTKKAKTDQDGNAKVKIDAKIDHVKAEHNEEDDVV